MTKKLTPVTTKNIKLVGVKQNNLKNVSVEFPHQKLTVITGLSGSGKSSLAFDTLYAEGQRRYIESLSTYTRQFLEKMPKPELEGIENIPPAIALEQKNHIVNSRSTVGTQTEIIDYLKLFYAKVGETFCINCGEKVIKIDAQVIADWARKELPGKRALILAPLYQSTHVPTPKPAGKSAKKSAPKSKQKAAQSETVQTALSELIQKGFQRAFWKKKNGETEILTLEEIKSADFPKIPESALAQNELFAVIDRLKLAKELDTETETRLSDSIDQALYLGLGKLAFFISDTEVFKPFDRRFACVQCGREHREPEANLFSFNSPIGACSTCSGFGHTLELDERLIVPDLSKTIKNGAIDPFSKPSFSEWQRDLFRFAERHNISIGKRYNELTPAQKKLLWEGDPKDDTFAGIRKCFEELKKWKYKIHIRVFIRRYQVQSICVECQGARLKKDALAVRIGEYNLPKVLDLSITRILEWFKNLSLSINQKKIAKDIIYQIDRRLLFLEEVGVGYLTLSRLAKTLSGGEFQRINLATQLGNGLCGTLYVLDEPSIGLHASDTDRLIRVLHRLRDQGNTVVVVEHDLEVIKAADWIVEMGPFAGKNGGEVVAQGIAETIAKAPQSVTAKYLKSNDHMTRVRSPRGIPKRYIRLTNCRENNLKNVDVDFPLDRFVVVTGVSGSGKSTLVHKTLHTALSQVFENSNEPAGKFDRLYGAEQVSGVVLLDQSPIGKSSRSNPATYMKAWDDIRKIYANQTLAMRRGFTPQHFSFNVDGGRCPVCKGEGEITLDMHFMAEVKIPCEECDRKRFKKNVLEVTYRNKNIFQLLETTIDEAYELFRDNFTLKRKLSLLREVGLGYLQVGQSATTLSGGESQRLKIASTLDESEKANLLYIFDEPTTGLHLDDVRKLLQVIQDLVDSRHSVIMIEHHLDVIAQADWVIDIGPGGGENGGQLIAASSPDVMIDNPDSLTGRILKEKGYKFPPRETGSPRPFV